MNPDCEHTCPSTMKLV